MIAGGMVPKVRAALGALGWDGRRGDHRRLVAPRRPGARPRRPDVRDPPHGRPRGRRRGRVTAAGRDGRDAPTPGAQAAPPAGDPRARRDARRRQPARARRRADRAGLRGDPGHRLPRHRRARPASRCRAATATSTSRRRTSPPAARRAGSDERLRRILADIPVTVGRSGLILVLTGTPGTASVIAQAIDESTLREQEGTLAGDNTLLVLFADEARLERWLERFQAIGVAVAPSPHTIPEVPVS